MKAIRIHELGGPEVMRLEEVADPSPDAGQVVIKVYAIGVNPIETYIRSGNYHIKPELPFTIGQEASGVIESIGNGVTNVKVGDRVYSSATLSGSYAEKTLCDSLTVHLLPDNVSFEQGAAIYVAYGTAYQAIFQRGKAIPGETIFINGASGGVGIAAVQLAFAAGMTVIGTGGTPQGRQLVAEQGAHHVLDHTAPDYHQQVLELTNGRGPDVIIEMLADVNLAKDLGIIAQDGRIVIVGNRGTVEINPRETMVRRAQIIGMLLLKATDSEKAVIFAAVHAGLKTGALKSVSGQRFALREAPVAHKKILERGALGKMILIP